MAEVKAYVVDVPGAVAAYRSYQFPSGRERKTDRTGLVNPPLGLDRLAEFYNESTWHRNAVRVKARDQVGHGWTLEREFPEDQPPPGAEAEKGLLDAFFWNGAIEGFTHSEAIDPPVPLYLSTSEVMERVVIDQDTIGNGYLAVIREDRAVGVPRWYAQVQGSKMRPHKDRVRYKWQDSRQNYLWFKRFGIEIDVHVKTGEIHPLNSLPVLERASEVIHFATYTPTDDYYGLPNITPAIGAMVLDLLARDFNVKFLNNNAVPQYAVIFEGVEDGDISEDTRAVVQEFFATARGNPGRTLVLTIPANINGQSATIRFEKLAVEVREGHFHLLREDSRNEVLVAHAVPGYRLGLAVTGQLGGSNITEADEIYKAEEVDPRRELLEERINRLIVRQGFGIQNWSFRFQGLDTSDWNREVDGWVKLVTTAQATPNEAIEARTGERVEGRPELDEYYWNGNPLGDFADGEDFALFEERDALVNTMLLNGARN